MSSLAPSMTIVQPDTGARIGLTFGCHSKPRLAAAEGLRVSLSRAPVPQRALYSRRRPSLPVAEREGASRRRREPRVGTTYWRCYGQNIQSSVISAHADRLQVGGLPEFVPRAAVDSRSFGCPCVDHSLRVKRAHRALARAVQDGRAATGELGDAAAAAPQDQAATICGEMAVRRAYVPLSSRPIRRE